MKKLMNHTVQLFLILLVTISFHQSFAQIPSALRNEINQNDQLAEKFLKEGNQIEAAKYFNKSAYILRNNQQNEEAAEYYLRILDINLQVNNQKGLLLIYNNLGMVYSDLEQFNNALSYLEKALELSKRIDTKEGVISALTNIAVALQGLTRYQESNQRLEDAQQV